VDIEGGTLRTGFHLGGAGLRALTMEIAAKDLIGSRLLTSVN